MTVEWPTGTRSAASARASVALIAATGIEVVTAVVASLIAARGWTHAVDTFVVSNSLIGASFGICGFLIAWHRPRNPVGWLLLIAGTLQAASAAAVSLADVGQDKAHWSQGSIRVLVTVFLGAWPWSVALCLPLVLLFFPDGALPPGVGWRLTAWATVVTAPLFTAEFALQDHPSGTVARPLTALGSYDRLAPLWTVAELRTLAVIAAGLLALVLRFRHGDERLRRQLLWLVLAVVVVLAAITPWSLIAGTPIVVLFSIPLIPAAMTVAILRYQLLDIRLVVSRTVLYALLTAGAVGVYAGLVAASDAVLHQKSGAGSSAAAAVVIAICFNPVRTRLQRAVDRLMYGDRADPVRAVSRVGQRLGTGLPGVLDAVREALRLPFAALRVAATEVAASGTAPELSRTIPLSYNGEQMGELVVGLRSGETQLNSADQAVLELLAAPLAVAVHATTLSGELQRSREGLVFAREDERRRLRRDLHDGLGAALTGIAFKADAVRNLVATDPGEARRLVAELRNETAQAIGDIRRLVYDLRPPALDELGLVGAVRQAATRLSHQGMKVRVAAPDRLPELSAAVEAAAYRIATEALTNAVRHSGGDRVEVRIHADGQLHVEVADDGPIGGEDGNEAWRAGVGLSSIRERAAELGGNCVAGPGPEGGLVLATLPLEAP